MNKIALALALGVGFAVSGQALAGTKVDATTKTYNISGRTGAELVAAMDRKGPRQGFTTRAIAQTKYTVGWDFEWEVDNGSCRLSNADGLLNMTYTFPKIGNSVSPDLQRRWTKFFSGVETHEQRHGRLAQQMMRTAEKSVTGISSRNDSDCRRTLAAAKRKIATVYAKYEAQQVQFDKVEHREGGNVQRLISGLVRD
ncbi:MAG: DUF922 domain-containing protein [Methylobacterium mesophilicum]|nr:DUF922 domain-containing protein [Methylobacterium mesophilicum]